MLQESAAGTLIENVAAPLDDGADREGGEAPLEEHAPGLHVGRIGSGLAILPPMLRRKTGLVALLPLPGILVQVIPEASARTPNSMRWSAHSRSPLRVWFRAFWCRASKSYPLRSQTNAPPAHQGQDGLDG